MLSTFKASRESCKAEDQANERAAYAKHKRMLSEEWVKETPMTKAATNAGSAIKRQATHLTDNAPACERCDSTCCGYAIKDRRDPMGRQEWYFVCWSCHTFGVLVVTDEDTAEYDRAVEQGLVDGSLSSDPHIADLQKVHERWTHRHDQPVTAHI